MGCRVVGMENDTSNERDDEPGNPEEGIDLDVNGVHGFAKLPHILRCFSVFVVGHCRFRFVVLFVNSE